MKVSDSEFSLHTPKEDDDPILEFQNLPIDHLSRELYDYEGIPFYNATNTELIALSLKKIEEIRKKKNEIHNEFILSFNPYRFSWLRSKKKLLPLAKQAFINLPSGAGLSWMAGHWQIPFQEVISTMKYVLNLIRIAQAKEFTVFIVGSKDQVLDKLIYNLKRSFPRLRIVGKHNGKLKNMTHDKVLEALKKTDPHILLLGLGFKKELQWIEANKGKLGNCLIITVNGYLDILAGKNKKAPDNIETKGLTWFWRAINRPHRWYRVFIIAKWYIEVLSKKWFSKKFNQKDKRLIR